MIASNSSRFGIHYLHYRIQDIEDNVRRIYEDRLLEKLV
jgi:hypothetical protein